MYKNKKIRQSNELKDRISFYVNSEISEKIDEISNQSNLTISDIVRTALIYFIDRYEKEKINKELEHGYKENSKYYLKMQEEWKYADHE